MKNLLGLFVMLALVSCAKARKMPVEEQYQLDNQRSTYNVNKEYLGELLSIENKESPAEIIIKGADAQKLFNALQIEVTHLAATSFYNAGKYKGGKLVYCYEQSEVKTPELVYHTCYLRLDRKSGNINENIKEPKEDKSIPYLEKDYNGKNVNISSAPGKILISFQKNDAKKLYHGLEITEFKHGQTTYKTGAGFSCMLIDTEIEKLKEDKVEVLVPEIKITEAPAPEVVVETEDDQSPEEKVILEELSSLSIEGLAEVKLEPTVKEPNYNCNIMLKLSDGSLYFQ